MPKLHIWSLRRSLTEIKEYEDGAAQEEFIKNIKSAKYVVTNFMATLFYIKSYQFLGQY